MIQMEVCVNSLASAVAAQQGGAIRVEFCDNLPEGGTTPSYAQLKLAKSLLKVQVYPIIRPRGGDFLYSSLEFELMKEDIKLCRSLQCDGIVTGILLANGRIDQERCAELIELAGPMKVAFHRAFDMSNNLEESLEDIINLGFERILSSGGAASALQGATTLKKLINQAAGRIGIMPGAGIREHNIAEIIRITGAKEFHASAKKALNSKMAFRNPNLSMGTTADEFSYEQTDPDQVAHLIKLANQHS